MRGDDERQLDVFGYVSSSPNCATRAEVPKKGLPRSFVRWFLMGAALLWSLTVVILVTVRWINPPTTAVHMERRLQAWIHRTPYHERYEFVPPTT